MAANVVQPHKALKLHTEAAPAPNIKLIQQRISEYPQKPVAYNEMESDANTKTVKAQIRSLLYKVKLKI